MLSEPMTNVEIETTRCCVGWNETLARRRIATIDRLRFDLAAAEAALERAREETIAFGQWMAEKTYESGGGEPGHAVIAIRKFRALPAPAAEQPARKEAGK